MWSIRQARVSLEFMRPRGQLVGWLLANVCMAACTPWPGDVLPRQREVIVVRSSSQAAPSTVFRVSALGRGLSVFRLAETLPTEVDALEAAWTRVDEGSSPPSRRAFAAAWDARRGGVVVFGGFTDGSECLGDTWLLRDGQWVQILAPAGTPPARFGAHLVIDPETSELLLVSGTQAWCGGRRLWDRWRLTDAGWIPDGEIRGAEDVGLTNLAIDPGGRSGLAYGRSEGFTRVVPETWILSEDRWRLGPIEGANGLHLAAVAKEPGRLRAYVFGGRAGVFSQRTFQVLGEEGWRTIDGGVAPRARHGGSMVWVEPGQILLYGGRGRYQETEPIEEAGVWSWTEASGWRIVP